MATISGTSGDDKDLRIGAGISGDTLLGLAGNDILEAGVGAGNNILRGGDGNDFLYAKTNDQLFGDAGNDELNSDIGGSGSNNTLTGGDGNDRLFANRNDILSGDAGDDELFAGLGGNTLTGGLGRDVFRIANASPSDTANTIADFSAISDTIRVNLTGVTQLSDLTFTQSGADSIISVKADSKQLAIVKNTLTSNLNATTVAVAESTPNNATVNRVPTITVKTATLSVDENSSANKIVGSPVTASDADSGDNLFFAITSGNNDLNANGKAPFAIDAKTGEIKVNDANDLDFERNSIFNLKIVASDDLSSSSEAAITVNLNNLAEATPLPFKITNYDFQNLPKLGTTSKGDDIFLGGLSGLFFAGTAANGNLKFVANTDRGPNGEPTGSNRPFLLPEFQPEIVSFELSRTTGKIEITKRTGLFRADGVTKLTGLPNLQAGAAGTAYTDEVGVDLDNKVLPNNSLGADLEGIVIDANGNYWLVDEYRPAIYQFDVNGKLLDRFIPIGTAAAPNPDAAAGTFGKEVLPAVYAQRRNNRGFEAVAIEGNKLYAFIQSAIDNPDVTNDSTSSNSRNLRILEFDIVTKAVTAEYLYILDNVTGTSTAKTDKIGDAVSLGNGKFAVVERDDRSTTESNKLIYEIDLKNATNINLDANLAAIPTGKKLEQLSPSELIIASIKPVDKTLIANAAKFGYTGVEKLEGLALIAPNTYALINDNDFVTANPIKLGILEVPQPKTAKKDIGNSAVFEISGGSIGIQNLVSFKVQGSAVTQLNELGLFVVDDAAGSIDGIAFGSAGYAKKAIERATRIFSAIDNLPNGFSLEGLERIISLDANTKFRFFSINDRTSSTDLVAKTASYDKIIFSDVNSLKFQFINDQKFSINFNGLTINVENSDAVQSVLGTGLQDTREGEVIDLTSLASTAKVDATFTLRREAAFDNFVGFYKVDNASGDIGSIKVSDIVDSASRLKYIQAAVNNRLNINLSVGNQQTPDPVTGRFEGNSIFAPFIIVNGRADAITDNNPNNDPAVYFPYIGANSDGRDHIRLLGDNTFGFEDLPSGGDFDYNDIIVRVKLTPVA